MMNRVLKLLVQIELAQVNLLLKKRSRMMAVLVQMKRLIKLIEIEGHFTN